jgi:CheY-like chemotaxis protein
LARILHVDDNEFWRRIIKRLLRNHYIDAAASFEEAVDLLQSQEAYSVALVDFNLHEAGDDGEGGELLELLFFGYPETKRIAVTSSPPGGAVTRLITVYGLEELIIKSKFSAPGLRRAVEEAITARPTGLSRELRLNKWDLRDRFRDWQFKQSDRIKKELRAAEEHLSNVRGLRGQARQDAEDAVVNIRVRQERFREVAERLRHIVSTINSEADFDAALIEQENAEEQFSDDGTGFGQ